MYLVVCYDIVSDRRRTRLFKRLERYLTPVQKSVFEGELKAARYESLKEDVLREMDPEEDTVRIYHLPLAARLATELLGTSVPVAPEQDIVI